MRKTLLILSTKLILCIRTKFSIVWRIEEDEVLGFWYILLEEIFKIHILYHCIGKVSLDFGRLHISNLSCQVFSIVRDTPIGYIKFPMGIVSEHRRIGILSHKEKNCCCGT